MPAQAISPDALAAAFPDLRGFDFINAGSYKTVYRVSLANGAQEVLKVIRLPIHGQTEDQRALRRQELGPAQREVSLLRDCRSPFGSRPSSTGEALQNWDCLHRLGQLVVPGDPVASLGSIGNALNQAEETYAEIGASGLPLRDRSNNEHIEFLREELTAFQELAEIQM